MARPSSVEWSPDAFSPPWPHRHAVFLMASEPLEQLNSSTPLDWLRDNRVRLCKFAGVGLSGVVVNLAVFSLAFHVVLTAVISGDLRFILANAAGFVVSVFTNFLLNDWWTWGDRTKGSLRHWWHRLAKYYVTASSAGGVQILTAWLSLTLLWAPLAPAFQGYELAPKLAVLTGIGFGMAINFAASHLWAFRNVSRPGKS